VSIGAPLGTALGREVAAVLNDAWSDIRWGLFLWLTIVSGLPSPGDARGAGPTSISPAAS